MRKRSVGSRKLAARKVQGRWSKVRLEQLESRQLLAPMLDPTLVGLFTQPRALVPLSDPVFGSDSNGNGTIEPGERASSLRIEASPRAPGFGGDLFAVARGPYEDTNNNGVLDPGEDINFNGALDCIAGRIFRINSTTGAVTRFNPTTETPECIPLGVPGGRVVPGGGDLGFGGYADFFDIAIDTEGIFDGQPAVYVSTVDNAPVLPGVGPVRNAIYRFSPSGVPLDFFDANGDGAFGEDLNGNGTLDAGEDANANGTLDATPDGPPIPFAMFTEDVNFDGTPDDVPAVLAFSPATSAAFIPRSLYVGDVDVDAPGDSNDFFAITEATLLAPITADSKTRIVIGTEDLNSNGLLDPGEDLNGNAALDLFSPSGVLINEDMQTRVRPPAAGLPDLDMRGFAFGTDLMDTIPAGRTASEDALYGVSTDIEDAGFAGSVSGRFFPPAASLTGDDFQGFSEPLSVHLWGDVTYDSVGFFRVASATVGGAITFESAVIETDHRAGLSPAMGGAVYRVQSGFADGDPFLFGFDVPESDLTINPTGGLEEAFSVALTGDGRRLFISDMTAIYFVDPLATLDRSEVGQLIGLSDLRDLGVPYRGRGLAVAVIDTGVDSTHGGFSGHVAPGASMVIPGLPGTVDTGGHGTAVAGIISQLVPDATIVPVQLDATADVGPIGFSEQITWLGIKYVADNPLVVDPVTGEVARLIAGNMSFGTVAPDAGNFDSELSAFKQKQSLVNALKGQFQRWLKLGITPVASAGNEGSDSSVGLRGAAVPGILRETVEVVATYPYPFSITLSTSPLDRAQSFSVGGPIPVPPPAGCDLEAGDFEVFADKVTAFSSRSPFSDFGAPGSCVRTFRSSLELAMGGGAAALGPLRLDFNGTSAAAPVTAGVTALAHSAVGFWAAIFGAGAATETNDPEAYLRSFVDGAMLPLPGIRNLASYANPDGINSILQWTAIPVVDFDLPDGLDNDDVDQRTLHLQQKFRTYSRVDVGNAVAAIEGAVALDYLTAVPRGFKGTPPRVSALDFRVSPAGIVIRDGRVTAAEIERFIRTPLCSELPPPVLPTAVCFGNPGFLPAGVTVGEVPTIKAMARLLGGTDTPARVRRMQFFDLAADGVLATPAAPSLTVDQFATLQKTLLPRPKEFPIQFRGKSLNKPYLLSPESRHYEDLEFLSTGVFAPGRGSRKSPGALSGELVRPLDPTSVVATDLSYNSGPALDGVLATGNAQLLVSADAASTDESAATSDALSGRSRRPERVEAETDTDRERRGHRHAASSRSAASATDAALASADSPHDSIIDDAVVESVASSHQGRPHGGRAGHRR